MFCNGKWCQLQSPRLKNVALHPGTKVSSVYYCDAILTQIIPEMIALSGGDFLFQQDWVRSHTYAHTLRYLDENITATAT